MFVLSKGKSEDKENRHYCTNTKTKENMRWNGRIADFFARRLVSPEFALFADSRVRLRGLALMAVGFEKKTTENEKESLIKSGLLKNVQSLNQPKTTWAHSILTQLVRPTRLRLENLSLIRLLVLSYFQDCSCWKNSKDS